MNFDKTQMKFFPNFTRKPFDYTYKFPLLFPCNFFFARGCHRRERQGFGRTPVRYFFYRGHKSPCFSIVDSIGSSCRVFLLCNYIGSWCRVLFYCIVRFHWLQSNVESRAILKSHSTVHTNWLLVHLSNSTFPGSLQTRLLVQIDSDYRDALNVYYVYTDSSRVNAFRRFPDGMGF